MTSFKQGDILLVPFPFTHHRTTKQRPAVVLSSETYNRAHPDIILAPITSRMGGVPDMVPLVEWKSAGLLRPSMVKPILSSFDVSLVRRQLGSLSASDLDQVRALFSRILDLP
ncbi:MAG: type II toxin-antitoxin system PemK/MazF family toxin [Ardenticatenaceae bacterium]